MAEYDAWAEYYDLVFRGLPGEAEFYVGQAARSTGPVLELGCGTGRLAIPMAMCGAHVTGVDISEAMLAGARAKAASVGPVEGRLELVAGDMRAIGLGRTFACIVMAYRTFMHLLTPDDQRRCLRSVHEHLEQGGVFILNMWAPKPSLIAPQLKQPEGTLLFGGQYSMPGQDRELVHYCASSYDEFAQRLHEEHFLQEIDREGTVLRSLVLPLDRTWIYNREFAHLAEACSFEVEVLFGDFDCNPFTAESTEMIWVLRRA